MHAETKSDPAGLETLESFSGIPAFNRWLYEKIKGYLQGSILETGSGIGNISAFLLENNNSVCLSDLRPEYCRMLSHKFGQSNHLTGIYELDLSLKDFATVHSSLLEKFDTVIALNVIEHIEEDDIAISNAKAMLRKNGRLIILVPAGQWLYNALDKELGHYRRYSKKTLNKLLSSAGLEIYDSSYFNAAAIVGWWFSGNLLREKIIPSAKLKIYNRLVPLFRIADWFITPFTGVSVISVGVKN